jgi:hypothetical protein
MTAAASLALIISSMTACTPTPTETPRPAQAPTPTSETRLGTLNFEKGFPTEETTRKLFDEMDYQRAVQAYLWAYPVVSLSRFIWNQNGLGADSTTW